uniref:OCEL domain-containing protein n=1 Tax=Urocitellus parryii TaxID=9999 RepID=A0A8D2HJ03_UROPR
TRKRWLYTLNSENYLALSCLGQDNVICLPVGFTGPVFQASYSHPNLQNVQPPQASPQIQDFQNLINNLPTNSHTDVPNYNLQLSNVNNDNNQGIIDHPQQTVSICSPLQLGCAQSIADEMSMSTINSSVQMMPVGEAQAEDQSCNKWKIIRKPQIGKRVPIRKAPQVFPDAAPERKRTAPINPAYTIRKSRIVNSVQMRPYRERVIHLLALKDYKKSELLIRLQKDGIKKSDKNSLGKILYQVADLNTQNFSYSLKNCIYREIQRDWPGYSELDKQSLDLVLSTKMDSFQNAIDTHHPESSIDSIKDGTSSSQTKLLKLDGTDYLIKRGPRISHLTTSAQPRSNNYLTNNQEKSEVCLPSSVTPAKQSCPAFSTTYPSISNPSLPVNSNSNSCSNPQRCGTQDPYMGSVSQDTIIFPSQPKEHTSLENLASISIQMYPKLGEKKKLESDENFKHKAKKQSYNTDMTEKKASSKDQDKVTNSNSSKAFQKESSTSDNTYSASGLEDYLTKYHTIVSPEQRWHYEQEFRVDYDEYQTLYAKMLNLSKAFISLESERKLVSPNSKEYHNINQRISLEYQQMRQLNPNFAAEKCRCVYLYNKLVHIKKLINNFDQQQATSKH